MLMASVINTVAATYWVYVSPNGNDLNSGTREQPLASLIGARDKIRQLREKKLLTDTVYVCILSGNYYMMEPLNLSIQDGGSEQNSVIFTGDATNRPVFYGGIRLNKFEAVNANLWRVFVPEVAHYGFYFEQLYINGERRFRAQTPNHGEFYKVKNVVETELYSTSKQKSYMTFKKIKMVTSDVGVLDNLKPDELDDALVVFYQNWSESRQHITSVSRTDTAFHILNERMASFMPINSKTRYIIENFRGALDSPGEWFLSRDGYLYFIPYQGETIENTECIAPVTERFVVIEGQTTGKRVEHIRFQNLCFRVAGYKTPIRGNSAGQAASNIDATVMIDLAKDIEFRNCELAHTGSYAIWFRRACAESMVTHCYLHDLGAGGVKIGEMQIRPDSMELTSHITIDNNIIQHGGYVFPDGVGVIIFQGSDNIITHNDIADFRYSGVSVGWVLGYAFSPSKRNKIEFNHIHHLGWGELSDMGGVYSLGRSEGTTISNNLIHHVCSFDYGGWGLYTDEGSSHIVMENNLVYNCKDAGFHQHYGKENIIRNNIFAFNVRSQVMLSRIEKHQSLSFIRNIVYFDNGDIFKETYVKDSWLKAIMKVDSNCYWDLRTSTPRFFGLSLSEWQKTGKDRHSIITDPLFVDPKIFDFHFKNRKVSKKDRFHTF